MAFKRSLHAASRDETNDVKLITVCSQKPAKKWKKWRHVTHVWQPQNGTTEGQCNNKHVDIKVDVAYQNLGIIKPNFTHLTPDCFILLYKCLVRSHIEYANSVWNTHYIENHKNIEMVQMCATKLIHELKGLPYRQHLERLKLPTLKYRRIRGDMIEIYKMLTGKYIETHALNLHLSLIQVLTHVAIN